MAMGMLVRDAVEVLATDLADATLPAAALLDWQDDRLLAFILPVPLNHLADRSGNPPRLGILAHWSSPPFSVDVDGMR